LHNGIVKITVATEPLLSVVMMLIAALRKLTIDSFLLSCLEIDEGCEETVTKELSENTLKSEFSIGLVFPHII